MSTSINTSSSAVTNSINNSVTVFIKVWCISIFIFGAIGHAFNIYVFTRRRFRSKSCVYYFLASTLDSYGIIYGTIPLRLLQTAYNIDVFVYSQLGCKILSYLLICFRVLPAWFIALAVLNRYFSSSTSATLRRWTSIGVTVRVIPLTVLFISLAFIHVPFNYTILLPQRSCNVESSSYRSFFSIWNFVFFSWIPSFSMLIFSLLTIRNVHQSKMRITPQNNLGENQKKIDHQLIRMAIIQSFVFGSTSTAYAISQLYISIISSMKQIDNLDNVKYNYVTTVGSWVSIVGPCLSFYLFTFTSQLFRRELIGLFHQVRLIQRLMNSISANTQTQT